MADITITDLLDVLRRYGVATLRWEFVFSNDEGSFEGFQAFSADGRAIIDLPLDGEQMESTLVDISCDGAAFSDAIGVFEIDMSEGVVRRTAYAYQELGDDDEWETIYEPLP